MVAGSTRWWTGITAWKHWTTLKWSVMAAAVFWMIVYRLSESASQVPEFVYVNF